MTRNIGPAAPFNTIGKGPNADHAPSIPPANMSMAASPGGRLQGQRRAVLRLNRAERELGSDGAALVHEFLILGITMEQVGLRRGLRTQRWKDYFARRACECLDRLALMYGFATANSRQNGPALKRSGCTTS
jgi:hypothetical protein